MSSGLVFKIQRFSLLDGPGIRTMVFLKGCTMRCAWCFNPESHECYCEVIHNSGQCTGCNACYRVCPAGAVGQAFGDNKIDKTLCTNCGKCVQVCPSHAMKMYGERKTAEEVADIVKKDKAFYKNGGGVTLTGGEVTLQKDFTCDILRLCREDGIHTALETSGYCAWEDLEKILQYTDYVMYDIKLIDRDKHKFFTGVGNDLIFENAVRISKMGKPWIVRIPIIPGCNDTPKDLEQFSDFIKNRLHLDYVQLNPYELLGVSKYEKLRREYSLVSVQPPSKERMEEISKAFNDKGIRTQIGG